MSQNPSPIAAFAVHPALTDAVAAVHAALAKAKKVNQMIDDAVAQVKRLHGEISSAQQFIASAEVDEALADDGDEKKALRKTIDQRRKELATKENDMRVAEIRIPLMEQKAPECDVEVANAGHALQAEYQTWVKATKTVLSSEIDDAIKPLIDLMAKVRAVGWSNSMSFLDDALVPDLLTHVSVQPGMLRAADISTNRLKDQCASAEAEATVAEIRALIQPAEQALAAVKSHRAFVPFDRSVKPYEVKGWGSAYHGRAGQQASEAAARA